MKNNLNLELNQKSRYYPSSIGIDFCGYRIFETHLLLRKRFKKKVKKTLKKWKNSESLNPNKLLLSWNSIKAHAGHANSYNFLLQTEFNLRKILEEKNIKI